MIETSEILKLKSATVSALNTTIVTIDGYDRVGKSWVCAYLSKELNLFPIELDDFIGENRKVDHARLKASVSNPTKGTSGCIINGVMVLKELDQIGVQPTYKIYVKALNSGGGWVHHECTGASDEAIKFAREHGFPVGTIYLSSLLADCIQYHRDYSPHLSANAIFENQYWSRN